MLTRVYKGLPGGTEECYYIESPRPLSKEDLRRFTWLLAEPGTSVSSTSRVSGMEVGPRLSIETPFSSNAVSICDAIGIRATRIEVSTRYPTGVQPRIDRMTQEVYRAPLTSFRADVSPERIFSVRVLEHGEGALREANTRFGFGMDAWDIGFYTRLFQSLGRNPTIVELYQLANMNSEHSRHWFFRGVQEIDGIEMPESLMDIVKAPWKAHPGLNLVAFHDNAGVIEGHRVSLLRPDKPDECARFILEEDVMVHITLTAETHNHPTGIEPYQGAYTGVDGRIRDSKAVGRGGLAHAGISGYCVGNLRIEGHAIPGEDGYTLPDDAFAKIATPLQILIRGSDGVSRCANEFGEPLIVGFCRSVGLLFDGKLVEFIKPILFSGGLGRGRGSNLYKNEAELGMLIVRIGGPAYRVGVGGGSASSMSQGANTEELDFKSVQRGNAEMQNRANRVIQAFAEMGEGNPIEAPHDQGAGGISNVLTELIEKLGGRIDIRKVTLGDATMSVAEIWVAEFQESYGFLVRPENIAVVRRVCEREGVSCDVVGEVTGDGRIVVVDSNDATTAVDLPLAPILGEAPRKRFTSTRVARVHTPFTIPEVPLAELVERVFTLPQVGSKRFLTSKIDRSVGGLVALQPCVGPMQLPVADAGVTAHSYFDTTGAATAVGEQPIKMLLNPAAGARMALSEMLTNLACVKVSDLRHVSARANWMWAAKLPGEGSRLYDAAVAMRDAMLELWIAINGGKDSLSMAATVGGELIVSPGQLVITGCAPVPDITKFVTPDLNGHGVLGFIDLGLGKNRLGGSSIAQSFGQVGDVPPDIDDLPLLGRMFQAVQELIERGLITAYHDRSDGGLITTIAEMCMAGNCGARVRLPDSADARAMLFSEEAGAVFEYPQFYFDRVEDVMRRFRVPWVSRLGTTTVDRRDLTVSASGVEFEEPLWRLRQWWEKTSSVIDAEQANPDTAKAAFDSFARARPMPYKPTFYAKKPVVQTDAQGRGTRPKVALVRHHGTNGEREMGAAFIMAGFEVTDIAMSDILSGCIRSLHAFRGAIFPGGFANADVFGAGKGLAALVRFNPQVKEMFDAFIAREDTFTFGVCNGCQFMSLSGWLMPGTPEASQPRFLGNTSRRFESGWSTVLIRKSPALMLRGMEGSFLGIHNAHGEGRAFFPDASVEKEVLKRHLAPLVYVDEDGEPTEAYPFNPNGSPHGITALCSPDGRSLAMMPHSERAVLPWQCHYTPRGWRGGLATPWLQMFHNAYDWCLRG